MLDDGTILGGGGPRAPSIDVVDSSAFFRRVGHEPKIGFGDAYVEGDWRPSEGTDLAVAMYPFARVIDDAVPMWVQRISSLAEQRIPRSMRNSIEGSKKNIEAHYDLSNDLFAQFLDPTLTYSSAMFDDARPWAEQTLQEAQERKVDAALDRARVGKGTRLLEIGTGWGTLAIRAAKRGAVVTTVTLSVEQAELARARAKAAGVSDRIDIRIQDYREVTGEYDAVVSIEMIEAVGEEYWQTYFDAIDRLLAPGGVAVVQAILMSHERYRVTRRALSWIQKHIFPGGLIPSVRAIEECTARTSMRITEQFHFGHHYAETLRRWRSTFNAELGGHRAPGVRRALPAHLGVLPGLQRGGIRDGLPGRGPVPVREGGRGVKSWTRDLKGQRIWFVGASSGIGAATARLLADRGASVAISGRRRELLDGVSEGRMVVAPVDVTDASAVASAAARVAQELGGIDTVVWCAAYWKQSDASDWDAGAFARHYEVNLLGFNNVLAATLPAMVERRARARGRRRVGRRLPGIPGRRRLRLHEGGADCASRVAQGVAVDARRAGDDGRAGFRADRTDGGE